MMETTTRFNGNRAWQDAMALISSNREVLAIIAGVFIFLPSLVTNYFMSGVQQQMMAMMPAMQHPANPMMAMEQMQQMMGLYLRILPWILVIMVAQTIGICAMMALLTDHRRPTVGEALMIGLKSLPTFIAIGLLLLVGYLALALVFMLVFGIIGGISAALGSPALAGVLAVVAGIAAFIGLMWLGARLSMIQPVVVIEQEYNPIRAITTAWRITTGQGWRMLGFFVVLMIAYLVLMIVISLLFGLVLGVGIGLSRMAAGGASPAMTLVSGMLGGLMSAAFVIVFTALLAAIHRQLSGPSAESIADTFA